MKKSFLYVLVFMGMIFISAIAPLNAIFDKSPVWHKMTLAKSGGAVYPTCIVPYYPEGIVYTDRIVRNSSGEPLDTDLFLRILPEADIPLSSQQKGVVCANVLSINGDVPRDDLSNIQLACVEVFHGKLYAGIQAQDGFENSDGTFGTNDTYRRLLYVSESVEYGEGLSKKFMSDSLQGAWLLIEGIIPGVPHLSSESVSTKPASIRLQLRSSTTEEGLSNAVFVGPDGTSSTDFNLPPSTRDHIHYISFPTSHNWVQYKVMMATSDGRVTPVLEKVELKTSQGTVLSDTDWSGDQLTENNNLFTEHSPGEIVLANRKLPGGLISMVKVIQAPCVEPPYWCYSLIAGGQEGQRAFKKNDWPYQAVGDLEPYKGNLYMYVGPACTFHTGCRCGDFVSYDYAEGLFEIEGHLYQGGDPEDRSVKTLWGEGAGKLRILGDILHMPQGDSKIGVWRDGEWRPGEAQEWYLYTTGNGEWKVGFTPPKVEEQSPLHIWDSVLFNGYHFIHTNRGTIFRPFPTTEEEHLKTSTWEYFGFGPPSDDSQCLSVGVYALYENQMFIGYTIDKYGEKKLLIIDENFNRVWERDVPAEAGIIGAMRAFFEYSGTLFLWDGGTLYYTNQEIYAPTNLSIEQFLNRSLSQAEYINILTWQGNPANIFISKYRLYLVEGQNWSLLYEVDKNMEEGDFTYEYRDRWRKKEMSYTYAVVAVDDENRESTPAYITTQGH